MLIITITTIYTEYQVFKSKDEYHIFKRVIGGDAWAERIRIEETWETALHFIAAITTGAADFANSKVGTERKALDRL